MGFCFIFLFFVPPSQDEITSISSLPFASQAHLTLLLCQEWHKTVAWSGHAHLSFPTKRLPGQGPGTQPSQPWATPTCYSGLGMRKDLAAHMPQGRLQYGIPVSGSLRVPALLLTDNTTATSRFPFREPGCNSAVYMKLVSQQQDKAPMYLRQTHHGRYLSPGL